MKKRYIALLFSVVVIVILGIAGWTFGSTTHASLEGTAAEQLKQFLDKKTEEIGFNGTILVAKEGEVLFSEGYGFADQEKQIENTADTVFHIASLSKSFTAVSILQLEEKGKLSVDDSLSAYFPDYRYADKITIHQLLNHSSGIPELISLVDNAKEHSSEELYEVIKTTELEFEPGSKYSYSNSGYLLLAMIIEMQSGMKLSDYMQTEILTPARMKNTYFVTAPDGSAVGYENMKTPSHSIDISIAYGSGNMLSTTGDLLLFEKAINEGIILGEEQVEKMQEPSIDAAPFGIVKYGYGWNVSDSWYSFHEKAVAHGGGYTGFKNFFLRFPEEELTVIILSNNQGKWNAGGLSLELASIMLKERFWYIINKL